MLQAWILSVVFDVNASDAVVSSTSDDSYLSVQSNTAVVLLSSHNDYFEEALLTVTKRKFFAKARKWKKGKKMEVETSIFKANRRKKSHPPPPIPSGGPPPSFYIQTVSLKTSWFIIFIRFAFK